MSKVQFMELGSNSRLRALEKKIVAALEKGGCSGISLRLFQDQLGKVGYSVQVVTPSAGKKGLDLVHRLVCEFTGHKRGRPPSEPTHQVKCRIRESTYQRLVAESKRRRTTPSTLLKEWLEKHVG
jgi:hypothetical protein